MPAAMLLAVALAASAPGAPSADGDLQRRLDELEARIAGLESQRPEGWLTERRAVEVRELVADVLADADTRTSRLTQGFNAGYEKGAIISSDDGAWLLRANLLLQTRFMLNTMSGGVGVDPTVWGFEVTRARFAMSGHVVSPDWFYRVQVELGSNASGLSTPSLTATPDLRTGLLDAYAGYEFDHDVRLLAGQFKTPLLFEELTSSGRQQAVDRSLVNYLYSGSRTQGIMVEWTGKLLRARGSWNNGINDGLYGGMVLTAPPGPAGSHALTPDTEWAFSVRLDFLGFGNWEQFEDYTSPPGSEMGVLLGGAVHVQQSESGPAIPDVRLAVFTLDTSIELGGWNVYGSLLHVDTDTPGPDAKPWAAVVGAGVYLTEQWELFGRYEWSDTSTFAASNINIATLGATWYLSGHHAKWTSDVGLALDPVLPAASAATGAGAVISPVTGWRRDFTGGDNQVVVRSQMQILF